MSKGAKKRRRLIFSGLWDFEGGAWTGFLDKGAFIWRRFAQ